MELVLKISTQNAREPKERVRFGGGETQTRTPGVVKSNFTITLDKKLITHIIDKIYHTQSSKQMKNSYILIASLSYYAYMTIIMGANPRTVGRERMP